jgi:glycosyltransferase involved in cell wall biosynthesis
VGSVGIIVPAHNEAATIRRSLDGLADLAGDADVVVVCNGCTDDTAEVVARAAPWARLVELSEPSKPAALNAGDAAVTSMPRLYLDADVRLTADGVRRLAAWLEPGELTAVAPTPRYEVEGASWIVRSHYRIWTELNTPVNAIYGTGAMMVSANGRACFGDWPDVIADDYFLDGQFAAWQKQRVADVDVTVVLPRRFWGCVSRKARVHQGKRDVLAAGLRVHPDDRSGANGSLLALVRRRPRLAIDVPAHVALTITARVLSIWRRRRGSQTAFFRDDTSRTATRADKAE